MKKLVLAILLGIPVGVFAQQTAKNLTNELLINPIGRDSVRFEVRHHEILKIDLRLRQKNIPGNWFKAGVWSTMPMLATNKFPNNPENVRGQNNISLNLGILGALPMIRAFHSRKLQAFIEVKQYATNGHLLKTERLLPSDKKNTYKMTKAMDEDGYLVVSIANLESKSIAITTAITNTGPHIPKGDTPPGDGGNDPGPEPESDAPIAWENYLGGVTITGTGTFANSNFMATYEAAFGPSETWIAVGAGSGDGNGSGSGGDGGYEPASAEAKKEARDLKKLHANECEAKYILEHAITDPLMATNLVANQLHVEAYMTAHNLGDANYFGDCVENAFKHAFISALNRCSIGLQHATEIANRHEVCNGVNSNPSNLEWFMDDYNNHQGFDIVQEVGCVEANILSAVWHAYEYGRLHDINGNPTFE